MKKIVLTVAVLFCAAMLWAQPADIFDAGNMEFGGELHLTWAPSAYITDADSREANEGEYNMFLDATGSIGLFVMDKLSLQFMPGLFYWRKSDDNGDDINNILDLSLGIGCDYYFTGSSPMVFSAGLDTGLTIVPGVDGKNNGADNPDDSLALIFSIKPNATAYYFVSERLAPYVSLNTEFYNYNIIKNNDGSSYDYDPGKGFMDYWKMQLNVTIGFKYFLPTGFRFLDGKQRSLPDAMRILNTMK